ncbi:MAG: hypothetical protein C0419_11825 [Microbacterium sp.]|nr:hypothetical protein [Microbacterium sp.]
MAADVVQPRVEPAASAPSVSAQSAPWNAAPAPSPDSWQLAAPPTPQARVAPSAPAAAPAVQPTSRRALRDAERVEPATTGFPGTAAAEQVTPAASYGAATVSTVSAVSPAVSSPAPSTRRSARAAVSAPPPRPTTATAPTRPVAAPSSQVPLGRRIAKKAFPPAVMLAVASLLVGTSVPANALFDPDAPPASVALSSIADAKAPETVALEDQVLEAEAVGDLATTAAARDSWTVTSYAEMLRLRYGSLSYSYNAASTGPIRWPFPFAAKVTSGFGDRVAPCRGCSSYHRGVDFDAGYGAPVGAIADGIVTAVGRSSSFGYRVEVEHIINGQKVLSLYAHLIDNSSVLTVGAPVVAGEIVGALGNTGLSTGPHLHLEIHVDGVPIDPFAWLVANTA